MVTMRWLFELMHGARQPAGDDVMPLIAKRFEERLAKIPPAERTDERLRQVFFGVVETARRGIERTD
jgi:hypothetical protein